MGATVEWDCIPFTLQSSLEGVADVDFGVEDALGEGLGGLVLLDRGGCRMGAPLRVSTDVVPQGDGGVPHRVRTGGYGVQLKVLLWNARDQPAKGATLVRLNDLLMLHLNASRQDGLGRLLWTPTDHAQRMVDDLWWTLDYDATFDGPTTSVQFGFTSPFPYATVAAETVTEIADGDSEILDNTGTADFVPVVKAHGPSSGFTIRNETTGLELVYDSSLPGASTLAADHYIEFDFFRNKAYLDGDVVSRKAGIDVEASDFFSLVHGDNEISADGADVEVLWQPAFA